MEAENTTPSTLGLVKSFGFGDRLGLAGPGHLAANRRGSFAPILAQQSIREMTRTQRTPAEVMQAARDAIASAGYTGKWGADADHLKTAEDVRTTAEAGFRFFTIDPSDFVDNRADTLSENALRTEIASMEAEGILPVDWQSRYLGKSYEVEGHTLIMEEEKLIRSMVKYSRAIHHARMMADAIAAANRDRNYEIEISVDETETPTHSLEHLFIALEIKRLKIPVISLAPRFIGEFEKGIDYKGDLEAFEKSLQVHTAIARQYGPYKISIHSGSDKFSIYPSIGRICGNLLHVKTAGTSYLEALRVVCRSQPNLFREITDYSLSRFSEDRKSYHISARESDFTNANTLAESEREDFYLDRDPGRQLLHVTFGSVLTQGHTQSGQPFKEAILETLSNESDLHVELLEKHLGKHIGLLES